MVFTLLVAAFCMIAINLPPNKPLLSVSSFHLHLLSPFSWTNVSPIGIVSGLYFSLERPLLISYHLKIHPNHPKVPSGANAGIWAWGCSHSLTSGQWLSDLRPARAETWDFFFSHQRIHCCCHSSYKYDCFSCYYKSPLLTPCLFQKCSSQVLHFILLTVFQSLRLPYSYQSIPWFIVPYLLWFYTTTPYTIFPCCNYCDS